MNYPGQAARAPGLRVRLGEGQCQIAYRSPSEVTRLLEGRVSSEAPELLAGLFAICPAAQKLACEVAIEAANHGSDRQDRSVALRAVRLESVREHGLRILLSWPGGLGEEPNRDAAAKLNAWSRNGGVGRLEGLLEDAVFGEPPAQWLEKSDAGEIDTWAKAGLTPAARFLASAHSVTAEAVDERSLLSRHYDNPVFSGPRWQGVVGFHLARLIDLATLIGNLDTASRACPWPEAERVAPELGVSRVAASRGTLEHRVQLDGDRIASYAITSPTDAAFGQDGYARRWIESVAFKAGAASAADVRSILSGLDPCVDARVEVV